MKDVIKNLETIVANSYALAVKTQNYHWNVTGPNFKSLHEMFDVQYTDLAAAVDEIAERIRMLGSKIDASFEAFNKLSKIKNGNKNLSSSEMLKDLASGHKIIVKMLREGLVIAQKNNDEAIADLLITRVEAHDKNIWMIEASL